MFVLKCPSENGHQFVHNMEQIPWRLGLRSIATVVSALGA